MISNSDMDGFLGDKMCFSRGQGAHSKYFLPAELGLCIPAVLPIQLQHGRGDVSKHIVRQIRTFFDVSERELGEAIACSYSMLALYCSFLIGKASEIIESARAEPVVYDRALIAFLDTIPTFLSRAEDRHNTRRLHRGDKRLIEELRQRLDGLKGSACSAAATPRLARASAALTSTLDSLAASTR